MRSSLRNGLTHVESSEDGFINFLFTEVHMNILLDWSAWLKATDWLGGNAVYQSSFVPRSYSFIALKGTAATRYNKRTY